MNTVVKRGFGCVASGLVVAVLAAVPAGGVVADRSPRVSAAPDGSALNASVQDAVLSGNAGTAVFVTAATNFLPPPVAASAPPADAPPTDTPPADPPPATTRDAAAGTTPVPAVVSLSLLNGTRRLVSAAPDGSAADGASSAPAVSDAGLVIAFMSSATNLAPGDTNGATDIFARDQGGPVVPVSVAADGGPADGASSQPDVSGDGRYVVFTSAATNLVAGDTNGQPDVFIRDLGAATTRRVSVTNPGAEGHGRSSAPAVNRDGSAVTFESAAPDLVPGDTNGVADVFVRVMTTSRTERVSRSSRDIQQDRGIAGPYTAAPDISGDGRFVVFDTEARSLYARDTNRRTDIYLRDRLKHTTTLVSANSYNVQGDNDSVTPRITPNGRFVTFQSFASNLVQDDGPGADLFIRDLRSGTTSLLNATTTGVTRAREPGGPLLQRAPLSDDGRIGLFLSGASNIGSMPSGGVVQLYARRLIGPRVSLVGRVFRTRTMIRLRVRSNEPAARRFLCRVDHGIPFACGPSIAVSRLVGRRLTIRAGGAGYLWSRSLRVPIVQA